MSLMEIGFPDLVVIVGGVARRLKIAQECLLDLVALAGHTTLRLNGG
ncbi:hypothetical protein SAMN05216228_11183, partial [Rhizobium tibeticum]